jgi:hypothetical protein
MKIVTIKKFLLAFLFIFTLLAFSGDFFFCNFNEMQAKNWNKTINPVARKGEYRTITGFGNSSQGAIFAMENLQDFKFCAHKDLSMRPAIIYSKLDKFPKNEGFCELWVAPFFNQEYAYRDSANKNLKLSYIFSLYTNKLGTPLVKRFGKSTINCYIHNKRLYVQFVFTNGKTTYLSSSVEKWPKKNFQKITITWDAQNVKLYLNKKLVAEQKINGQLDLFNSLEIGGRDVNLSFQGIIDDIKISSGKALDVISPEYEGDPLKYKTISISRNSFLKWVNAKHVTSLKVTPNKNNLIFNYSGKYEHPQKTSMVQTINVKPASYIKTTIKFKKLQWQYGSRANFLLEFLDKDNKVLKTSSIDSSTIGQGYISMVLSELSSLTAINEVISYFNYFITPKQCVKIRLIATFAGNPCSLELIDLSLREVDPQFKPWFRQPAIGKQLTYPNSPAISDKEVEKLLKNKPRAVSKLVKNQDRIEWYINGKKTPPVILHNPITGSYQRITAFKDAGFKLFTSAIILGKAPYPDDYNQIWKEDGSIDVTGMEKAVYRVLREIPEANVILNFIIYPNAKWLKENPKELHLGKDGNPLIVKNGAFTSSTSVKFPENKGITWSYSIHSRKFRNDIEKVLTQIMEKFEKTPASKAVVGIYVTGGDDGQFRSPVVPDASPVALKYFHQFLLKKYKTIENLSLAWKKNVTLSDIKIPTVEQLKGNNKIVFTSGNPSLETDYREFISKECTQLKKAMRKAIKQAAPRLLVGGYDCAMGVVGSIWYGRGAYNHIDVIKDPNCDFLISLPGYERGRDECLVPMGLKAYTGSMKLHQKLMISEMDIRNPEQPPLGWLYKSRNWQAQHSYQTFSELLKLYSGYAAAWSGAFHAYSMGNNYYNTPEALLAWKNAAAIASNAPGEKLTNQRIAWINEERYSDYFCNSPLGHFNAEKWNRNTGHALWLSQVRFDAYLAEDLFHKDFVAPKVLLLGNLATATPKQITQIRKRFLKDNRTIIYLAMPGILSGHSLKEISAALDIDIIQPPTIKYKSIFVNSSKSPILKNITGFLYSPTENRPFVQFGNVGINPKKNLEILAYYQNTNIPGLVIRRNNNSTEIFIGQPGAISPMLLRNIAIDAKIRPITNENLLTICGGGLIVLGNSEKSGIKRVYYQDGVKQMQCLTGQKIITDNGKYLEFYLEYGKCAIFKCIR